MKLFTGNIVKYTSVKVLVVILCFAAALAISCVKWLYVEKSDIISKSKEKESDKRVEEYVISNTFFLGNNDKEKNESDELLKTKEIEHLADKESDDDEENEKEEKVVEKELEEKIPFKEVKTYNNNLELGITVIKKKGVNGILKKIYEEVYCNNTLKSKKLISEKVIKKPVNQTIEIGTKKIPKTSKGKKIEYKKVINMKATAYTAEYGLGITALGIKVKKGVVAVDPRVIKLGTKLYVEGVGKTSDYGYAIAADTGGAVKGSIIDLYFENRWSAMNWGRRNVNVYVLK